MLPSTRKPVRELLYLSVLLCGDLHTCLPALNVAGVHSSTQRQAGVGGEAADLLGLVVGVGIIDTVQPSTKPHLPPTFWEDAELVFLPVRQNTRLC